MKKWGPAACGQPLVYKIGVFLGVQCFGTGGYFCVALGCGTVAAGLSNSVLTGWRGEIVVSLKYVALKGLRACLAGPVSLHGHWDLWSTDKNKNPIDAKWHRVFVAHFGSVSYRNRMFTGRRGSKCGRRGDSGIGRLVSS